MTDIDIDPMDHPDLWHGAVSWEPAGRWRQPWRLPPRLQGRAYAPELFEKAKAPAGVRAAMISDARELTLELDIGTEDPSPLDLLVDDELVQRAQVVAGKSQLTFALPGRRAAIELWLPQHGQTRLADVQLRDTTGTTQPAPQAPRRWICYGSSITQCRHASGPSETWPALVARAEEWDLLCLGFGGQCHLDPVVADTIRDQRADLISLCLGINVYGAVTYSARTWRGRVADFIARIREAHSETPIVVMSPIASPAREASTNAAGVTLTDLREGVHEVVADMSVDDSKLHLVDGTSILRLAEADLLADGLHPGPLGYRTMAARIGTVLKANLSSG
ncbi:SGNH/GDSL hydrolase family protein [Jiangella alkaliphila]|uniref:GDSL-like Lipase/Acylhydrolase family protein n=1 Tax=Jiangella alkaliphila TaxID=419479 RepID=A0A1H2LHF9_9ACTN|nr:SGNH/GDSL hydrolase family protein [Jiangella alkaliphila]SDU79836.1 GDSL-like Lipase/Acylhydrolase family protein [Jiangella alkaliphila]